MWIPVYEGEEPEPKPEPAPETKQDTFTQEQLNSFLADARKKDQASLQTTVDELTALKTRMNLTSSERDELESKLSELQKQSMSKEELAAIESSKIKKAAEEQIKDLTAKLEATQQKYTDETLIRALTDGAVSGNAYNPEQIVALLRSKTKLQEVEEGGELQPRIDFPTVDAEGKPVVLNLTVKETIELMRETDSYLNLFKGDEGGGLGTLSRPGGKPADITKVALDHAAYVKGRRDGTIKL